MLPLISAPDDVLLSGYESGVSAAADSRQVPLASADFADESLCPARSPAGLRLNSLWSRPEVTPVTQETQQAGLGNRLAREEHISWVGFIPDGWKWPSVEFALD